MTPSHYLNQCWNIVNRTLRNKLRWKFYRSSNISIGENTFENVVCETVSISSRPQCAYCRYCIKGDNDLYSAEYGSDHRFINGTPHLALRSELWSVLCEYSTEKRLSPKDVNMAERSASHKTNLGSQSIVDLNITSRGLRCLIIQIPSPDLNLTPLAAERSEVSLRSART